MTLLYLVLIAATATALWKHGNNAGRNAVQVAWNAQKAIDAELKAKELQQTREVEQGLQRAVDIARRESANEIAKLSSRHDAIVTSLRQRQARPIDSNVDNPGVESCSVCSGSRLYRDDGEFLARLAQAADEVVVSLNECRAAYDAVKYNDQSK